MEQPRLNAKTYLLAGLLGGLAINACDVTVTVTTVADDWNRVLLSQGLQPSAFTPPYYIAASFVGSFLLCWTLVSVSARLGFTRSTALRVSILLWTVSRLYGLGHVVMGQMPPGIFIIMSAGLLLGYLVAGQVVYAYLRNQFGAVRGPVNG